MITCGECEKFAWYTKGTTPAPRTFGDNWGLCTKHGSYTRATELHFSSCPELPTIRTKKDTVVHEEESE